jgi:uncharacterized protein with PQ loop repeat
MDCKETTQEQISTILGFMSIGCWICVMIPQLYRNYKNGSAGDVSIYLILLWFIGDSMNGIGVFLTNQLLFQKISAILFITVDILALSQKLYYFTFNNIVLLFKDILVTLIPMFILENIPCVYSLESIVISGIGSGIGSGIENGLENGIESGLDNCGNNTIHSDIGLILGYIASFIYIFSRIPQIIKLRTEKKTTLPVSMFMFAILGNLTYSSSILVRTEGYGKESNLFDVAPWLFSSIITMILDIIILYHVYLYTEVEYADTRIHPDEIF